MTAPPCEVALHLVGLDIGGANLKAADGCGIALQHPFALWKEPHQLGAELRSLLKRFGAVDRLAVTMTGELCDCFESKAAGVRHILDSVAQAAPGIRTRVWTTAGDFFSPEQIHADPLLAAAANWLALATYAGRLLPHGNGLLIDLGSTTCDIIPIVHGVPQPQGRTDPARLASGELVDRGVRRTPLCAVFGLAKAAEWFATTADAYVVLGELPEEPERTDSADGRPFTKLCAQARLARMECDEAPAWTWDRTIALARQVREIQVPRLAESVALVAKRLPGPLEGVVLAGEGEFLLPAALSQAGIDLSPSPPGTPGGEGTQIAARISLAEKLGPAVSAAACAHAVAVLAAEQP